MSDKKEIWVTTKDNPFDPFTQFNRWMNYDEQKGYHTCGKVARLAHTSDDLTDYENDWLIDQAINEVLDEGTVIGNDGSSVDYDLAVEGQTVAW